MSDFWPQKMAQEKPGQTLQSTALAHDAYIRLVDVERAQNWDSRRHRSELLRPCRHDPSRAEKWQTRFCREEFAGQETSELGYSPTILLGILGWRFAMRVSTTVRYGARAIAQVASANSGRAVSVREIAEQQRISPKYLEHILRALKAGGLVQSVRGKEGGYVLTQPPESITLKDLYESLEGSLALIDCVDCPDSCSMHDICPTRDTWVELKEAVETVLERTTIGDLVERKKRKAMSSAPIYQI